MSAIMSHKEAEEYHVRLTEGCWYCNHRRCVLTHKADSLKGAKHPERDPYAEERPYWGMERGFAASEVLRLGEQSKC
jgi:hypothetical protein